MISTVSFHPFISHLPIALFVAALGLLYLARWKNNPVYAQAAAFNFSMGFLAAILANFTGMVSADLALRTTVEVESHQGYSFLFTVLYGFCTGYSYTRVYTRLALGIYAATLVTLCASAYSGYLLVFR
ncbi:MAG: hypothetical protein COV67_00935 [Nitrospinae bacterium CG11_big_fil_rev_8_21_14_0_20_56_8]|nr:MAG: hypothetical protein COV67_00935 [Nitrospinae bacterium CG11_big_fil_rev_8_21_14_0_20_56_8]